MALEALIAGISGKTAPRQQTVMTIPRSTKPPRRRIPIRAAIAVAVVLLPLVGWRAFEFIRSSASVPGSPTPSDRPFGYVRQSAEHSRAIVFVHGILGGTDTWESATGVYWPELVKADSVFDSADIYVSSYDTGVGNQMDIDEIAVALEQRLVDAQIFARYSQVIFVVHSMGGLVLQKLLLTKRQYAPHVPLIVFYSTPQTGAALARLISVFSSDPALKGLSSNNVRSFRGARRRMESRGFPCPSLLRLRETASERRPRRR